MNDLTELDDSPASAPAPADELISRHFDEPLPPDDHGRLTRLLHEDPQALLDFVATARLHQALENRAAVLRPAAASGKRKRPLRWFVGMGIGAAAAAALVAGGGWMIFGSPQGGAGQRSGVVVTVSDIPPPPPEQMAKAEAPGLKKRIVKVAGAAAAAQAQPDLEELLGRYYVGVTPHGLTVPQALKQLDQAIREVNILSRPAMNQLRYEIGASVEPDVEDPVVLTPLTPPMTVKTYLETCGLFRKVTRQPGNVVYGAMSSTAATPEFQAQQMAYKTWPVPADFLTTMPRKIVPAGTGSTVSAQGIPAEEPKWTPWEAVTEFFYKPLEEGSVATFSPYLHQLAVRSSPAALWSIEDRLALYLNREDVAKVFISSSICTLPRIALPAGFDESTGLIMTDSEFGKYMRFLSQAKEVNLFSVPSVIARWGQRSRVEILREIPPSQYQEGWETMGFSMESETQLGDEFSNLKGNVRLGVLGNDVVIDDLKSLTINIPEPEASDGKVHNFSTEYELWLPDRHTAIFTLDVPLTHGLVAILCVTSTKIDETGQPVALKRPSEASSSAAIPFGIPVADKPGFVLSPYRHEGMVDVAGLPSGTKVICPFTKKQFRVP